MKKTMQTPEELLNIINHENTGFIEKVPTIFDFVQGLETGIDEKSINPSADWTLYLPSEEKQHSRKVDFLACTTFSHLNVREININFKLKHNLYPTFVVDFLKEKGFIDQNGKVNFSDRYIAKLSFTDLLGGNNFTNVADTVREFGLVPESAWPTNPEMTWDEYYKEVPESLIKQGKEILKYFNFMYEWVDINLSTVNEPLNEDTIKALKQSPLQIAIPIPAYHATTLYNADLKSGQVKIFDHYNPFYFKGDKKYQIHYSMKLVEEVKLETPQEEKPSFTFTRTLRLGMNGNDVTMLQKILKREGYFKYIPTGYFGYHTRDSVKAFQRIKKLTVDGIAGTKQTLALLNEEYGVKKKAIE